MSGKGTMSRGNDIEGLPSRGGLKREQGVPEVHAAVSAVHAAEIAKAASGNRQAGQDGVDGCQVGRGHPRLEGLGKVVLCLALIHLSKRWRQACQRAAQAWSSDWLCYGAAVCDWCLMAEGRQSCKCMGKVLAATPSKTEHV